jgi:hypothetical protein
MSKQMAQVTLVEGGGVFLDADGKSHFIKGYGQGQSSRLDLDPRVDLTRPIWEQVQKLAEEAPCSLQGKA